MALVTYSDSEASDSELTPVSKNAPHPVNRQSKPETFQPLVDRGNPRKILVSLPDTGKSGTENNEEESSGPARKKQRTGGEGGGGAFSGFNSFLPAPKRTTQAKKPNNANPSAPARKPFSLKTGATPGFDRGADAEMRLDFDFSESSSSNKQGDGNSEDAPSVEVPAKPKEEVVEKKGNITMFKPLSVSRNNAKKKKPSTTTTPSSLPPVDKTKATPQNQSDTSASHVSTSVPPPKKKISLFGVSNEDKSALEERIHQTSGTYEPLLYNNASEPVAAGPEPDPSQIPTEHPAQPSISHNPTGPQSLASVANDLNLSDSEMRQLFGRQARHADSSSAGPNVINFNTDEEYKANAEYLSRASEEELASQQHNPVRSIAPGKHNLQQLVNAVSNQRDALEESFAAGRRNRKEAGARYGW